jgi:N utilization substance protein B
MSATSFASTPALGSTCRVRRTDQRRAAIWALYQSDLLGRQLDDVFPRDTHAFTRALAQLVGEHRSELDELISRHASGWSLERIAPLERSILRVGLVELLYSRELPGEREIPPEGAIDEAVETAKHFCGADAPSFVNGILAAVLRERDGTSPTSARTSPA